MDCQLLLMLIVFGLREVRGSEHVSLTTAVVHNDISPKPTTMHRRIQVQPDFEQNSVAPLDLFRLKDKELRRSRSNVWHWDYWCQLQPRTGNCTKNITRYYYSSQVDQCLKFSYSGCGGNKNQFETVTDCERYCKGYSYMPMTSPDLGTYCFLQPDSGLCMALFFKYYYDVNENRCKSFIYGGCGGNQNSFNSIPECVKACKNTNDYSDVD